MKKVYRADFCVCGGGASGWIAACAAARMGKKVIMLERNSYPGGLASGGYVGPVSKCRMNGEQIIGGIPWEFLTKLSKTGDAITTLPSGFVPFDSEAYKFVAFKMLRESGVQSFYGTTLTGATAEQGYITSVSALCEGTPFYVEADYFMDATGSGVLLNLAAIPHQFRQQKNQPLSLVFKLVGVDTEKLTLVKEYDHTRTFSKELREILEQGVAAGKISSFGGPWSVWGAVLTPGMVSVNATRCGAVPSDPEQYSYACEKMHSEIPVIVELFHQFEPYKNARLAAVAPMTGVRESRELIGKHRIAFDELFDTTPLPDSIALGGHPVDRHCADSSAQNIQFLNQAYQIPYASMIPQNGGNVMAAGALISADPDAYATLRVQAQCMACGQAAGVSAALGMPEDIALIRAELKSQGAVIDLPAAG